MEFFYYFLNNNHIKKLTQIEHKACLHRALSLTFAKKISTVHNADSHDSWTCDCQNFQLT